MADYADLSERAQHLFRCLVKRYVAEGQPVGSRTLARDAGLDISAATVRNVMADLEDLGLVRSPHTSAGRVPTARGYRLFVDAMMSVEQPDPEEVARVRADLEAGEELSEVLERASTVLSEITHMAGLVMVPRRETRSLRRVEFLPLDGRRVLAVLVVNQREVENRIVHTEREYTAAELEQAANYLNAAFAGKDLEQVRRDLLADMSAVREEVSRMMQATIDVASKAFAEARHDDDYVLAGQTHLMEWSELSDIDKLRQLFDAFARKRDILHLLEQALEGQGVQVFIGEESGYEVLDECSVVTAPYELDGRVLGVLGVIGPTRMDYDRVVPVVDLTARLLGATLKSLH